MPSRPPSVDALATAIDDGRLPRALLIDIARRAVGEWRREGGEEPEDRARREARHLASLRLKRILNATGVLLHTNLGRAPLHPDAAAAEAEAATGFTPLEFDPVSGARGSRGRYAADLVISLTGAESALVVNNNAGALLLTVAALAGGGQVVISRGEQIEIGGTFRLPEIVGAAGARGVEVGTTNRTRLRDYSRALGDGTRLILKVHPSNYRVEGFASQVGYGELAALAGEAGIPMAADIGSGLLDKRAPWLDGPPPPWLEGEPGARQTLEAGADLVLFSGDKLLGGPQAGIVAGRRGPIDRLRSHPLARAVRASGPALAALEATLHLYASGRGAEIPFWEMAMQDADALADRSRAVVAAAGIGEIVESASVPGAGTVPGRSIPGPAIAIPGEPETLRRRLLEGEPPVVARIEEGRLLADLRSIQPGDDDALAKALAACR